MQNAILLRKLLQKDSMAFCRVYKKVIFECVSIIKNNIDVRYLNLVQYTRQTPALFEGWCNEICGLYDKIVLISQVSGRKYIISDQMKCAASWVNKKVQQCSLFSGDLNLHNIIFADGVHYYLDFEYWGFFDVDYILAKLIGSLFHHCTLFENQNYKVRDNEIYINYSTENNVKELVSLEFYKEELKGILVDFNKIKSFILAKLYFRLLRSLEDLDGKFASEQLTNVIGVLDMFNR